MIPIKVLHACFRYFPDRGGSETYTSTLAAGLRHYGVTSVIVTATSPEESFEHEGIKVRRIGDSEATFAKNFAKVLDEEKPDIVHLHARTTEWSHIATKIVESRRRPCVLTYHIAGTSCLRGDLMRQGVTVCTGKLDLGACCPCYASSLGLPRQLAERMMAAPSWFESATGFLPKCRLRTACQLRNSVGRSLAEIDLYFKSCARIVVLSEWSRQVLLRNGIEEGRILLSRIGTHHSAPATPSASSSDGIMRGIFVGRLHASKGIGLVAKVLQRCNGLPLRIDAFGPSEAGNKHVPKSDRVRASGLLADHNVVETMRNYDFAIVPSQILETGPYTVVEALQAGLPVIGSDLPAINEIITHDVNGWLVTHDSEAAWEQVFRRICAEPSALRELKLSVRYDRTMQDVADEMLAMYQQILGESA